MAVRLWQRHISQKRLDEGNSAASEIRQAEEEWLLDICRGFRAKVVIRPVERPYKYDRSEFASALAAFLNGAGIKPPIVPGIAKTARGLNFRGMGGAVRRRRR